jgi:DNA-binding PadR family transcriptional regulator
MNKLKNREICVYDLVKEGFRPSSAYSILKKFAKQGIVDVRTEKIVTGFKVKRYYKLNELGRSLLEILEKINKNRLNPSKKKK